jgi:SAM-dependent methyltransferase
MEDPLYAEELPGRFTTARRVLRLLERRAGAGRLLDVGCGPGVLLAAAGPGWRPQGVELSEWAVRFARERHGAAVVQGTIEDAGFPDGSFDAVTLLDVIEHAPFPRRLLGAVRRVLRPGGAVFVLTPDLGAPLAAAMGRWWWGLRPAHLYYFSLRTLAELLAVEGFRVRTVRRVGRTFSLGYWISRLSGYAPRAVAAAARLVDGVRLAKLPVYVNTFDSIGVLAVKEEGRG